MRLESKKNPEVEQAVLEIAGLQTADLSVFHELREQGYSSFIHGSIFSDAFHDKSDLDFAIVGERVRLPSSLEPMLSGTDQSLVDTMDYLSMPLFSRTGRKMSLHIEQSTFRDGYPNIDEPYSHEYRPLSNAKKKGISSYVLGGVDERRDLHIFRLLCPQMYQAGGVVNVIPQTGLFYIDNELLFSGNGRHAFNMKHILTQRSNGRMDSYSVPTGEELMLVGLEFDKLSSDTSLFADSEFDRYVARPLERSEKALGDFIHADPARLIMDCFRLTAEWRRAR